MYKILVSLTVAMCLFFAVGAHAAEQKIGFFNITEVGPQSDAYKAKLAELQKEFEKEGQDLQKQNEAFQKKVNDFQLQQQALSPEARNDRQTTLTREKRDLDDKLSSYMRKRQTAEQRAEIELHRLIFFAVQEYGAREKYTAIMEQSGSAAVYVDPKFDLSKSILQETNKVWKEKPKNFFSDNKN